MRCARLVTSPLLLLALGCGVILPSEGELGVHVDSRLVVAGEPLAFTVENRSSHVLTSGDPNCAATFERRVGGKWTPLQSANACPAIAFIHGRGDEASFTVVAPPLAGTYRLVLEAWEGSGESRRVRIVKSGSFEVLPDVAPA